MMRCSMSPLVVVFLTAFLRGLHICSAIVCEGTADDDCNGMRDVCTDTGLCVVGLDGVKCESISDSGVCDEVGITSVGQNDNSITVNLTETSTIPTSNPVEYECEFINQWSAATHPIDYPNSAHWSPMVIVTHSDGYQMWAPDMMATDGVQSVAETGSTRTLADEVDAAGSDVASSSRGVLQFNSNFLEQLITGVKVDESHPFVSSITMIAPSPDWFSGFYGFNAADNGFWYQRFVIDTFPFDSGTDSGDTYTSPDDVTDPQVPIFQLTVERVAKSGVFVSPDGLDVYPVARWDCSILSVSATPEPVVSPSNGPSWSPSTAPSVMEAPLPSSSPSEMPVTTVSSAPSETAGFLPSSSPSEMPVAVTSSPPSETAGVSPSSSPSEIPDAVTSSAPSDSKPTTLSAEPTLAPSGMPTLATDPGSLVPSTATSEQASAEPSTSPSQLTSTGTRLVVPIVILLMELGTAMGIML